MQDNPTYILTPQPYSVILVHYGFLAVLWCDNSSFLKSLAMKKSNRDRNFMLLCLHLVVVAGCHTLRAADDALPGSFAELLNFRSIPRLKSWRTFQASGYDRGGGFYDSGNFLRIEDNRNYVLMEANGPG